jgi:zinc transport system substrate-binding protein
MRRRHRLVIPWVTAIVTACVLAVGCTSQDVPSPDNEIALSRTTVCVDNYPLQYFAQRIAGDAVDVVFPVPAGEDPAFWHPDEEAIRRYQDADLILLNGASYAKWTAHVSLPDSRSMDTSKGFAEQFIPIEHSMIHSHGPGGEHSHQGVAFTTWLDPRLALEQAIAAHTALTRLMPEHARAFDRGLLALKSDLEELDARLDQLNQEYFGQPLLASHPVYQYLARRCGWNLQSVHWEPHEVPADDQWQELDRLLATHPAPWMIWEAPPRAETEAGLTSRGIRAIVFSPCGNVPVRGDYLTVMRQNFDALKMMLVAMRGPAKGG